MSLFEKFKKVVSGGQSQQNFTYLTELSDTQLKALTTDGQSKAEKYAAQQELLKRPLSDNKNMAFNDLELKRTENAIETYLSKHRPPVHIREKLDIECRIEGQSVVVYEVRPQWRNPTEKSYLPVAKTTFVRTQNTWKVYWQRADLKWHQYEPQLQVKHIDEFFTLLAEDEFCCFWG